MSKRIEIELPGAGKVMAVINGDAVELGDIAFAGDIVIDNLQDMVSQALGTPIKRLSIKKLRATGNVIV